MPLDEVLQEGQRVLTVCNACRYCEGYCPVFPAMEQRLSFARGDLMYLANLCHNCGECLYACQYAPPHEFGINVPTTFADIRLRSYEEYSWPRVFSRAFRHHSVAATLATIVGLTLLMAAGTALLNTQALWAAHGRGEFYAVIPHNVLITVFGAVGLFVIVALGVAMVRFWRDTAVSTEIPPLAPTIKALREAFTLTHLHTDGHECVEGMDDRRPWRRWFHHCTLYGFALCFLSTCIAAVYHSLGWRAPYAYTSAPVVFGTIGGIALLVGPAGLLALRRRRDPALGGPAQAGLDVSFILLLFATSATGLLLLALRERAVMGSLLLVHLSCVLALFVTLPYGKFVHGLYRTAALVKSVLEADRAARPARDGATVTLKPNYEQKDRPGPQVVPASPRGASLLGLDRQVAPPTQREMP